MGGDGAVVLRRLLLDELPDPDGSISGSAENELWVRKSNTPDLVGLSARSSSPITLRCGWELGRHTSSSCSSSDAESLKSGMTDSWGFQST